MDAYYLTFVNIHSGTKKHLPPFLWARKSIRSSRSILKGNLKIIHWLNLALTQAGDFPPSKGNRGLLQCELYNHKFMKHNCFAIVINGIALQ